MANICVGILTFHFVNNYGAVIQAESLQIYLRTLGISNQILDVQPFYRPKVKVLYRGLSVLNFIKVLLSLSEQFSKSKKFKSYRKKYLQIGPPKPLSIGGKLDCSNYSHIVVGSDQVWNPKYGDLALGVYTLGVLIGEFVRVSYAACAGSSVVDVKKLVSVRSAFERFDFLSVRDNFTKKILEDLPVDSQVTHVLDPTFLVDWKSEMDLRAYKNFEHLKGYVFVYGYSVEICEILEVVLKINPSLKVVAVGMEGDLFPRPRGMQINSIGPDGWLELIRRAEIVVTKSFHGMALAINMRKELYVPVTNNPSSDRIHDLCSKLGISDSFFENKGMCSSKYKLLHIKSYDRINSIIEREIHASREFLKGCIGSNWAIY